MTSLLRRGMSRSSLMSFPLPKTPILIYFGIRAFRGGRSEGYHDRVLDRYFRA